MVSEDSLPNWSMRASTGDTTLFADWSMVRAPGLSFLTKNRSKQPNPSSGSIYSSVIENFLEYHPIRDASMGRGSGILTIIPNSRDSRFWGRILNRNMAVRADFVMQRCFPVIYCLE